MTLTNSQWNKMFFITRQSPTKKCISQAGIWVCVFICCWWEKLLKDFGGNLAASVGFPGVSDDKESTCNAGDLGMATHASILGCRIPWTEETDGLQSMGSQRVRYSWATTLFTLAVSVIFLSALTNDSLTPFKYIHWNVKEKVFHNVNVQQQSRTYIPHAAPTPQPLERKTQPHLPTLQGSLRTAGSIKGLEGKGWKTV